MSEEMVNPDAQRVQALRAELQNATKRLTEEKAAKKRDSRIHGENIRSIEEEISEIMGELDDLQSA